MMLSLNPRRIALVVAAACNAVALAPGAVFLGTASNYAILTETGISTVPTSAITGNIAVSPIAGEAITGFGLILDSEGAFATASQFTGKAYAANFGGTTPTVLTTAVGDMHIAYTDAAGRANTNGFNLKAGLIGGETLTPGVYTFTSDISISTDVTLEGTTALSGPDDVFILQTTKNVLAGPGVKVTLTNGVKAENVFWQVAGRMAMDTTSVMNGILLVKTAVSFATGSTLNGRILAQTACTLQSATITQP